MKFPGALQGLFVARLLQAHRFEATLLVVFRPAAHSAPLRPAVGALQRPSPT